MPDLILASTSPYRRELLARLRVPFTCVDPGVDEASVRATTPDGLAQALARAKATAVAAAYPDAVVIGGDQVVAFDRDVLGKPGSAAAAFAQLRALQGREHRVVTAAAIAHPGGLIEFRDIARMKMWQLPDAALQRYVAADDPVDCAGSYRIESLGIALFESIVCQDHTAIVGLPMLRLAGELRKLGFHVP